MTNSSANAETPETPEVTPTEDKDVKKFFFETEFDFSETEEDIQSVTVKQLQEAKEQTQQQAFDEGYQKGVEETNADIARIASDQLFVITSKLEELVQTERQILDTFHSEVAQLCEVITAKILPVLSEKGAKEEVQEILTKTLESVPRDEKVLVKVNPDLVEEIDKHLQTTKGEQFTGEISVQGDPTFAMTDCQAKWEGTGVERYMSVCLQEIGGALERLSGDGTLLQMIQSMESQAQEAQAEMATQAGEGAAEGQAPTEAASAPEETPAEDAHAEPATEEE